MANSGSRDRTHHSIDILRVDAENARAVAVGGEIAGCDAPATDQDNGRETALTGDRLGGSTCALMAEDARCNYAAGIQQIREALITY